MLDDHELVRFLFLASAGLFTTTLLFAVLWIRARERALRAHFAQRGPESLTEDLTHLVQAVDAVAIEVERISEAQRYTALTLAQRANAGAGGKRAPERVITPH